MTTQNIIESWENGVEPYNATTKHYCDQCKREMNIVDYLVGIVCMKCCRKNHAKVTGKKVPTA